MKLYEIPQEIELAINAAMDVETGEVVDQLAFDALSELESELENKALNIACMIKNYDAESEALKSEAKKLTQRANTVNKKSESLKRYLLNNITGSSFSDSRAKISWSKSTRVIVDENVDIEKLPAVFYKTTHNPVLSELKKNIMAYNKKLDVEPKKGVFKNYSNPALKGIEVVEKNNLKIG